MGGRFEQRLLETSNRLDNLINKDEKSILILGSYHDRPFERLEDLKLHLIDKGYIDTNLVSDLNFDAVEKERNRELTGLEKSIIAIETAAQADLILAIFFDDCDNSSLVLESKHIISDPIIASRTLFFGEPEALRALPDDLFSATPYSPKEIDNFVSLNEMIDSILYTRILMGL